MGARHTRNRDMGAGCVCETPNRRRMLVAQNGPKPFDRLRNHAYGSVRIR